MLIKLYNLSLQTSQCMDKHQVSSRSGSPSSRYRADQNVPKSDSKVLPTDKMLMLVIIGGIATPLFRMSQSASLSELLVGSSFAILSLMIANELIGKIVYVDT